MFVAKLDATGTSLIYSTYIGGRGKDAGNGIAVDSEGNVYVTGRTSSLDFPTTSGALQVVKSGFRTPFVTKLDPTGSSLVYSTFLGGKSDREAGLGIAIDSAGSAYVTGLTDSRDFPTLSAFQPAFKGGLCIETDLAFAVPTRLSQSSTGREVRSSTRHSWEAMAEMRGERYDVPVEYARRSSGVRLGRG